MTRTLLLAALAVLAAACGLVGAWLWWVAGAVHLVLGGPVLLGAMTLVRWGWPVERSGRVRH